MKIPKIVIGAGFGDEGKGLITDFLCAKHGADVVVRFSGGAQAGHTVVLPSGERHVFGHMSSGSFAGATTYLGPEFIVNPIAYYKELELFSSITRTLPDVYIHGEALVTTPYDMLINQLVEEQRGSDRHGSCGMGINETVVRTLEGGDEYDLRFGDLNDTEFLKDTLIKIRDKWFPARCAKLGIDPAKGNHVVGNINVLMNFMDDCAAMWEECFYTDIDFLWSASQIVFEGAQGLLLDQNNLKHYPHVTRANTGLTNALEILSHMGYFSDVDVYYTTRCYLTRHGAGDLERELFKPPYANVVDETNLPNSYQGSLRFAHLDIDQLNGAIASDIASARGSHKINKHLAITCLDQLGGEDCVVYSGGKRIALRQDAYCDVGDAIAMLAGHKGPLLKSTGPTRLDVTERTI